MLVCEHPSLWTVLCLPPLAVLPTCGRCPACLTSCPPSLSLLSSQLFVLSLDTSPLSLFLGHLPPPILFLVPQVFRLLAALGLQAHYRYHVVVKRHCGLVINKAVLATHQMGSCHCRSVGNIWAADKGLLGVTGLSQQPFIWVWSA